MNASKFLRRKEWGGDISETEPARLTMLIRRGRNTDYDIKVMFSNFTNGRNMKWTLRTKRNRILFLSFIIYSVVIEQVMKQFGLQK